MTRTGIHTKKFQSLLASAVVQDRKFSAVFYGPMSSSSLGQSSSDFLGGSRCPGKRCSQSRTKALLGSVKKEIKNDRSNLLTAQDQEADFRQTAHRFRHDRPGG